MKGNQDFQGAMFSYISLEERVPQSHPLRKLRAVVDALLATMNHEFDAVTKPRTPRTNRPLKKRSSNTLPPLISKARAISTRLPSDFECHCGLFSGHLAHFGRTYLSHPG